MIRGILVHCTNMEINNSYVDAQGQSKLAFGVSELLAFDLLPSGFVELSVFCDPSDQMASSIALLECFSVHHHFRKSEA